jgi:hypothetical protein
MMTGVMAIRGLRLPPDLIEAALARSLGPEDETGQSRWPYWETRYTSHGQVRVECGDVAVAAPAPEPERLDIIAQRLAREDYGTFRCMHCHEEKTAFVPDQKCCSSQECRREHNTMLRRNNNRRRLELRRTCQHDQGTRPCGAEGTIWARYERCVRCGKSHTIGKGW